MLEISLGTVLFSIANFALLVFALIKFLYKPIVKMLDDRKKGIDDALNAAEDARQEVARTGETIRADLATARQDAEAILAAARSQGEETQARIIAEAHTQAAAFTAQARQEIAEEKESAIGELKAQVADLAILIAQKALDGQLTEQQERNLLTKYANEVQIRQ